MFVLGGSLDTRNKLLDQETRSVEEIQNLLNEASEQPSSIEHIFVAIWNILQSRFKIGSPNHIRGLNLQYYFLGFLNYGCNYVQGGNVEIQKFDYSASASKTFPVFECSLAKEGCQSDNDCHSGEQGWCSGESARLPPMCSGFDSRTRRHMWAEFVGSLLCSERFFSGNSGFPLSSKTNI